MLRKHAEVLPAFFPFKIFYLLPSTYAHGNWLNCILISLKCNTNGMPVATVMTVYHCCHDSSLLVQQTSRLQQMYKCTLKSSLRLPYRSQQIFCLWRMCTHRCQPQMGNGLSKKKSVQMTRMLLLDILRVDETLLEISSPILCHKPPGMKRETKKITLKSRISEIKG